MGYSKDLIMEQRGLVGVIPGVREGLMKYRLILDFK
jgi:hypothetical protein